MSLTSKSKLTLALAAAAGLGIATVACCNDGPSGPGPSQDMTVRDLSQSPGDGSMQTPDGSMPGDMTMPRIKLAFMSQTTTAGTNPIAIAAADANGDTKRDLFVANLNSNNVTVLLSTQGWKSGSNIATAVGPNALTVGDFNGDTYLDLAVACNNASNEDLSVLRGAGNGGFPVLDKFATGRAPTGIVAYDFDGDKKLDAALSVRGTSQLAVLPNNSAAPNVSFGAAKTFATADQPTALVLADLNADTFPDLVTASYSAGTVNVHLRQGTSWSASMATTATGTPIALVAGEFTGDSKLDVVAASFDGDQVSLLKGKGDGTFETAVTFPTAKKPRGLAAADIDKDGKLDLIIANSGSDTVSVWLGKNNGTFEPTQDFRVGSQPFAITAADLDGDGKTDIATANYNENAVTILFNQTQL